MDNQYPVDNEPSIKLRIKIANKDGTICLSSIYGSYNYICDIDTPKNELAEIFCPHCDVILNTNAECNICKAPMVMCYLDMGGKINICSRTGCKNHNVVFDDLSNALNKLYQVYGFHTHHEHIEKSKQPFESVTDETKEEKEILETGTFLQAYCPFCRRALIENDILKLKIVNEKGVGYIELSPFLNVFSSKSTVFLAEGKPVGDLRCFHCDESLVLKDKKCELCGSQTARIHISARSKLIDFYICSKKGCRWHGLSEDDINEIKLDDSLEW
ncbi:MAG: hypothetical protein FJ216_01500 [Ignavibacteria bacterium]|nr:hypothetical protein [Ignavibacteria bacterium]